MPPEVVSPERLPSIEILRACIEAGPGPRVTIYLPLERGVPSARQNRVRLDDAVGLAERQLAARGHSASEAEAIGAALRAVDTDLAHLDGTPGGLALLAGPAGVRAFALPAAAGESLTVAQHFALRPLLAAGRRNTRYRVLTLAVNHAALFAGDAFGLAPATAPGLPASLPDALGEELTGKEMRVRGTGSGGSAPFFYAHGTGQEERKLDLGRYHEAIARALAPLAGDRDVPLVLCGTEEHQGGLRRLDKLPALLEEGVAGSPERLEPHEIAAQAWPVVERWLAAREAEALAGYEHARNHGKGLDLLDDVAQAALAGRVHRLFVDAAARVPGRLDAALGRVATGDGEDDVLDALVEAVLVRGGEVVPVAGERLPSRSGVAAELR